MDLLDLMQCFVRIADAGSMSAAARGARRSRALVSRQLRALEQRLGTPLMRRTTRRLDLTPAGRIYLEHCRGILGAVDEAEAAVASDSQLRGDLVVSAPTAVAVTWIAPLLAGFLREHPRVQLELRLDQRVVDLLEEGVDLALRTGPTLNDSTSLIARPLASYDLILCATPRYLRAHGTPRRTEELAKHACLVLGSGRRSHALRFIAPTAHEVSVSGPLRANNGLAIRAATLAGLGIGLMPSWMADEALATGGLRRVLPEAAMSPIVLHAVYHRDSRGTARITAFLAHLQRHLPRRLETVAPSEHPSIRARRGAPASSNG
jgi:DNA-binding transcriptional LysR family regulator